VTEGYEVRRVAELEEIPVPGAGVRWRPIRRLLGIRAFGINAYTAAEGEHVVEEHSEESLGQEEVYVVLAGRARFTLGDGDEVEAEPGTIVYLREPSLRREAVALEDGTTVLAVGGKPGEAFEPSPWEWWFAASPHRARGDYAKGLEIVREGLAERPEHPVLSFQVACYEALCGNADEAFERLRFAVENDPGTAEWAREHPALESLRDDPRFAELTR
jgi:quercetin dioxygenase-like cupin family protein